MNLANVTTKQWFQIIQGTIGGLVTGAALLQTLLGQDLTIKIVAGLGILNIIVTAIATPLMGQGEAVKEVLAMPGVDHINVNAEANSTLAKIAVDPSLTKITPTPAALQQVAETAKGA